MTLKTPNSPDSNNRCNTDRALDVYTKVIKKHPAAVVLHALNHEHTFMSYDGLFILLKGRAQTLSEPVAQASRRGDAHGGARTLT